MLTVAARDSLTAAAAWHSACGVEYNRVKDVQTLLLQTRWYSTGQNLANGKFS